MATRRFDSSSEWDMVSRHPAVRFRPREVIPIETAEVTLPVALSAAQGRLADVLGTVYSTCAVLVGLRLGPGASVGQLDLMVLARSGRVALGECKQGAQTQYPALVNQALLQLERYQTVIRGTPPGWLRARIDDSYARFGFPDCSELLQELGLSSPDERGDWWETISRTIRVGRLDTFIAVRRREEPTIHFWVRSEMRLNVTRAAQHNSALQRSRVRVAHPGR